MADSTTDGQSPVRHAIDWRVELVRWIFSQGPFAVILACLMWWLYTKSNYLIDTAVPEHLNKIQQGYREIQASNKESTEKLAATFEKEREREREVTKEAVNAIKELTVQIRNSQQQPGSGLD